MPNSQCGDSAAARRLQRSTLCLAIGAALASIAPLASAQTVSELKGELETLQRRIAELEKKQQAAAPANVVTGGDIPGSFKLPGSDTSVKIGGYVKLDAIYSSKSAGANTQGDQLLVPGLIPVGPTAGDNERNQLAMHARQSRLNVTTSTPTGRGAVTTFIEGDFFGADGNQVVSNSHNFRLRHAYGTIGNFGAGQFWTNFLNTSAFADTLDFGGPAAQIFIRQTQVRWTQKFGGGEWAVSAENPESALAGTTPLPDDDRYPDLIARVNFGRFAISAMARNIRIDTPTADEDKWGGALFVSGRIPIPIGRDDFRFGVYGGNVIGRYTAGFNVDGVVDATGGLSLPEVYGGFAAYRHLWSSELRSNLVLSASSADNPSATPGTVNKDNASAHLNLIWSPAKTVDVGVEYIYARREVESGASGSLNRVQFSAQYSF